MSKKTKGEKKDNGKLEAKVIAEFYVRKYKEKARIERLSDGKYKIICGELQEEFTPNDLWSKPYGIIFIKYFQAAVEEKDEGLYYHFPIPDEAYKKISEQPDKK